MNKIEIIRRIQDCTDGSFFRGKKIFLGKIADEIKTEKGCALICENERGSVIRLEISCTEDGLSVAILEKEPKVYEYSFCIEENADVFFLWEKLAKSEAESVKSYIKRYSPDLFDENDNVLLGEFTDEVNDAMLDMFWQRILKYAVLSERAKKARPVLKKSAYHIKLKHEEEIEPTFFMATRGAFIGMAFFLILLIGWYVFLRE